MKHEWWQWWKTSVRFHSGQFGCFFFLDILTKANLLDTSSEAPKRNPKSEWIWCDGRSFPLRWSWQALTSSILVYSQNFSDLCFLQGGECNERPASIAFVWSPTPEFSEQRAFVFMTFRLFEKDPRLTTSFLKPLQPTFRFAQAGAGEYSAPWWEVQLS